jgi:hypothetical protein
MRRSGNGIPVEERPGEAGERIVEREEPEIACFFCEPVTSEVGSLRRRRVGPCEPRQKGGNAQVRCEACAASLANGIMLVQVDDAKTVSPEAPFRTGNAAVVTEKGIRECIHPAELVDRVLKERFAFVPLESWEKLGLDRHFGQ